MTGDSGRSAAEDVAPLEVRVVDRTLVADLVGDIDIACSVTIEAQLARELERDVEALVLDLSRTTYIDSSGVRMIFGLARALEQSDRALRLVVSDEAIVRRVVILTRLDAAVPIFACVGDALSAPTTTSSWSRVLPVSHTSAKAAREFVRTVLEGAGVPERSCDEAVLAANELVTNAIRHARTECVVRVDLRGGRVRIEVEDRDLTPPRRITHDLDAVAGRGLLLVEQVAADWGHDELPDGKVVWCEVRAAI